MFFIVNDEPILVECKSGVYRFYVYQYSLLLKTFNISNTQSFLAILNLNDEICSTLTQSYDITVTNEKNFFLWFIKTFRTAIIFKGQLQFSDAIKN